jgi:hypothetical protein
MNESEEGLFNELVILEVTNGYCKEVSDKEIEDKRKEFLGLLRRGSFTLEQLENSVFSRYIFFGMLVGVN